MGRVGVAKISGQQLYRSENEYRLSIFILYLGIRLYVGANDRLGYLIGWDSRPRLAFRFRGHGMRRYASATD